MNPTLIPLHPHTNLFAIEVPEDATDFFIDSDFNVLCGRTVENIKISVFENLYDSFELLGTVKNKVIDFDCEPYVEHHVSYPQYFKDYNEGSFDDGTEDYYKRANGSFISLMESNNLDLTKDYVILKHI